MWKETLKMWIYHSQINLPQLRDFLLLLRCNNSFKYWQTRDPMHSLQLEQQHPLEDGETIVSNRIPRRGWKEKKVRGRGRDVGSRRTYDVPTFQLAIYLRIRCWNNAWPRVA